MFVNQLEERLAEMVEDRNLEVNSEREAEDGCIRADRDPGNFDEIIKMYDQERIEVVDEQQNRKRRRRRGIKALN